MTSTSIQTVVFFRNLLFALPYSSQNSLPYGPQRDTKNSIPAREDDVVSSTRIKRSHLWNANFEMSLRNNNNNNNNNKPPSSRPSELLQSIGAECVVGPRLTLVVSTPGGGNGSSQC